MCVPGFSRGQVGGLTRLIRHEDMPFSRSKAARNSAE